MKESQDMYLAVLNILLVFILAFTLINMLPLGIFWVVYLALVLFSYFVIIKSSGEYKLLSIITLEVGLYLILLLNLPNNINMGRDAFFEAQSASIILERGHLDPTQGTGFAEDYYGYTPVLHIIMSFVAALLGQSTMSVAYYTMTIVLRILFVLCANMLILSLFKPEDQDIGLLATFFFLATPRLFLMIISRRLIAGIFLMLAITAAIRSTQSKRKLAWDIFYVLCCLMTILGDHSIAQLFMLFGIGSIIYIVCATLLASFGLILPATDFRRYPMTIAKVLIYFACYLFINTYFTTVLFQQDIFYFQIVASSVMKILGVIQAPAAAADMPTIHTFSPIERILSYGSQLSLLLLAGFGMIIVLYQLILQMGRKRSVFSNDVFMLYFSVFGFIGFVVSAFLLRTSLSVVSMTYLWFFSIPISVLFSRFVSRLEINFGNFNAALLLLSVVVALLFTGSILLTYQPANINREGNEDLVFEFDAARSLPVLYSGRWLAQTGFEKKAVLGDTHVFDIYSGIFRLDVTTGTYIQSLYLGNMSDIYSFIYGENYVFGSFEHTMRTQTADFFVYNKELYRLKSFLLGDPLSREREQDFNSAFLANRIYDSPEVTIYENKYHHAYVQEYLRLNESW